LPGRNDDFRMLITIAYTGMRWGDIGDEIRGNAA
jgi:hypothetical protein